jgi:GrpB-like predicted nucleotidyltransferase (UPF0157 family)/predicted kinase
MIVIINGPLGIGKTEVSWGLVELFDQGVMLDGDYIGAVHPFEIYDDARIAYLYQTIHHLVAFHLKNGYSNFVINYVFETPESLAQLRGMLSELDDVTYAFRLSASEKEIEQRVRARENHSRNWELERFRKLSAIMESGADRGDMGFEVVTNGMTAGEVAKMIWLNIHEAVEIVPYDPAWRDAYQEEEALVRAALGELALAIHHIGSTAVPGLVAKPIIDIMVAVRRLEDAIACIAPLRKLDYAFIDHPQNIDRRYFRKGFPRTHHLHIVEEDSASLHEHIAFRDALRASPSWRQEYADLKTELASQHKEDRATYSEKKSAFVARVSRSYLSGEIK